MTSHVIWTETLKEKAARRGNRAAGCCSLLSEVGIFVTEQGNQYNENYVWRDAA